MDDVSADFKKNYINYREYLFGCSSKTKEFRLVRVLQAKEYRKWAINKEVKTLHLNLNASEEQIFNGFKKNYRNEIRSVEKKIDASFSIGVVNGQSLILEKFAEGYNRFAKIKKIRKFNLNKVVKYSELEVVYISCLNAFDKRVNLYHLYYVAKGRARLIYSYATGEPDNNKDIGKLNRFLHWKDICYFKSRELNIYDFGGISNGATESIDKFKKGFGGVEVKEFNQLYLRFFN